MCTTITVQHWISVKKVWCWKQDVFQLKHTESICLFWNGCVVFELFHEASDAQKWWWRCLRFFFFNFNDNFIHELCIQKKKTQTMNQKIKHSTLFPYEDVIKIKWVKNVAMNNWETKTLVPSTRISQKSLAHSVLCFTHQGQRLSRQIYDPLHVCIVWCVKQ